MSLATNRNGNIRLINVDLLSKTCSESEIKIRYIKGKKIIFLCVEE